MSRSKPYVLRGLLGLSVLWALLWIPLGVAAGVLESLAWNRAINWGRLLAWDRLLADAPGLVAFGAVSGFLFGVVFHIAERHRNFADLSLARAVVWSIAAAAVIPGVYVVFNGVGAGTSVFFLIYGGLNSLCAMTTLTIARRARSRHREDNPRELPLASPEMRPNQGVAAAGVRDSV